MTRRAILLGAVAGALLLPAVSGAQQPTRRRVGSIEIRGQVPTPQVVTVRPREVPAYSRQVISPNFYDRNFWPSILPGYQLVPQRMITGAVPVDSTLVHDTTAGAVPTTGPARGMTVRPTTPNAATPNLRTSPTSPTTTPSSGMRMPARADSARTDPARTTRPDSARTPPPDSTSPPGTAPAPARP